MPKKNFNVHQMKIVYDLVFFFKRPADLIKQAGPTQKCGINVRWNRKYEQRYKKRRKREESVEYWKNYMYISCLKTNRKSSRKENRLWHCLLFQTPCWSSEGSTQKCGINVQWNRKYKKKRQWDESLRIKKISRCKIFWLFDSGATTSDVMSKVSVKIANYISCWVHFQFYSFIK